LNKEKTLRIWTLDSDSNNQLNIVDTIQNCVYDVYNLQMNSKELIKLLEKDGWILRGSKGSNHVFKHPLKSGHITVPHPKKDLGIGLVQKLIKQAGIQ
jgi:predicted RNA binding protein YcfA (HicA-like mRNA interferase family)